MEDHQQDNNNYWDNPVFWGGAVSAVVCAGSLLASMMKVSEAHQIIVRSGFMIKGNQLRKNCFVVPILHTYKYLNMTPIDVSCRLSTMSSELLQCELPTQFTVRPNASDESALQLFASLMSSKDHTEMVKTLEAIIEGELRVNAAKLTMEELFSGRDAFRQNVVLAIDKELAKIGMCIVTANIMEFGDIKGSTFFENMRQRAQQAAISKAKVDTAEAERNGMIGEATARSEMRQRVAELEAKAKLVENEQARVVAESLAELDKKRVGFAQMVDIAKKEANAAVAERENLLQQAVERQRMESELEKRRADELSKQKVDNEMMIERAEADKKVQETRNAQLVAQSTAEAQSIVLKAEGLLQQELKRSEGMRAVYNADAEGLEKMREGLGGDASHLQSYFMIKNGTLKDISESSAKALKDMKPTIHVIKTGSDADQNPLGFVSSMIPYAKAFAAQNDLNIDWLNGVGNKKKN